MFIYNIHIYNINVYNINVYITYIFYILRMFYISDGISTI